MEEVVYDDLPTEKRPGFKRQFIDDHIAKIHRSNAVLIANYTKRGLGGYIGPNALMEVSFAYAFKKPIFLLEAMDEQPCRDEVMALGVKVILGDLTLLK